LRALGIDRLASQMYGRGIISHLTCAIIPKSGARRAGASAPPSGETICAWSRCMSEIRVRFSDSALEAPLTGLPSDIAESCHLFRMAIKNLDQADGSFTGLHNATLILLERSTPTADNPASFFLGQAQLFTNGLDPRRISHAQFPIGAFYGLQIFAGVDRIAIVVRIPTCDIEISRQRPHANRLCADVTAQEFAGIRVNSRLGHESQIHLYGCFRLLKFEMRCGLDLCHCVRACSREE
jgi:hypothetical protein